ncbi:MAG TPA: ABC transporter ATP-binding protein, partial [Bdellovibrionota bacterium]|nr:ABC transporter ATP-binding protein [Bdellovibrionota bacterium]
MNPILKVENLSHFYGKNQALNDVCFEFSHPQIFGFLGPNGSGKSTLFNILATILTPSQGQVSICGNDLLKSPDHIRNLIGVVFQAPSLDKKLSIYENLKYQGQLYGLFGPKLNQKIELLLNTIGLETRQKDLVEKLSGGLKRRVEIAKALLHDPKILILDEPSTGLDPAARINMWKYLKMLNLKGVAILVTTHLMDEADKCDMLFILDKGQLVSQDTPEALKKEMKGEIISIKSKKTYELQTFLREDMKLDSKIINNNLKITVLES